MKKDRPPVYPAMAYRPKDAAKLIGISVTQLYRLIERGDLVYCKFGGASIIRHEELQRVLDDRAVPVTKAAHASIR
jgi:excisionase family DNA binding protein